MFIRKPPEIKKSSPSCPQEMNPPPLFQSRLTGYTAIHTGYLQCHGLNMVPPPPEPGPMMMDSKKVKNRDFTYREINDLRSYNVDLKAFHANDNQGEKI
jgi:hypothetical protein